MANKVLKERYLRSISCSRCSILADLAWPRILLAGDDWGCGHFDPVILKAFLFPRRHDVTEEMIAGWLDEYEAAGMLFRWKVEADIYGYLINNSKHNSEYRSKWHSRKTPPPPDDLLRVYLVVHNIPFQDIQDGSIVFQTVPTTSDDFQPLPTTSKSRPTPNPTHTHTPKKEEGDLSKSPFFPLAKRILENALNVNEHMKSEAGYDEAKKLKGFVDDLRLLGTRTWPQLSIEQVVSLANKIWDWVLTHEGSNGFRWREVILSGHSFYKGCSSHLKNGGNLIAQYETAKNKQPGTPRGPQRPTRTSEETISGKEVFK